MPADYRELTAAELNALAGQELSDTALAALLDAHVAAPANLAAALGRGNNSPDAARDDGDGDPHH